MIKNIFRKWNKGVILTPLLEVKIMNKEYKKFKLRPVSEESIYLNELSGTNDWYDLSLNYELSEEIIDKFADKVYWNFVSSYQTLSERLIEKSR